MNKKFKINYIIVTIILGIISGYFVYLKGNLNIQQVFIYIGLRTFGISFLFFQNKFLKILSFIQIIFIGFLLLLGLLPLYKNEPDFSNFYKTQSIEYIFQGNPDSVEIIYKTPMGEQKIKPTQKDQKILFIESDQKTISFNEMNNIQEIENKLIIKYPDNTIIIIYSGSEIDINNNTITKNRGNIEFYQPTENRQTTILKYNPQEQKNKSDFNLGYIITNYENTKIKYIIDNAGGNIIMQPIYQNISKKILILANYIRPNIYDDNINNYEKYKQLLGRKEAEKTKYEKEKNRRNLILGQIQKGRKETRLFKQIDTTRQP